MIKRHSYKKKGTYNMMEKECVALGGVIQHPVERCHFDAGTKYKVMHRWGTIVLALLI
jgi:hypothetical protein